jgi:hypothetical protein
LPAPVATTPAGSTGPARPSSTAFIAGAMAVLVVAAGGVTWWRRRPARYWPA